MKKNKIVLLSFAFIVLLLSLCIIKYPVFFQKKSTGISYSEYDILEADIRKNLLDINGVVDANITVANEESPETIYVRLVVIEDIFSKNKLSCKEETIRDYLQKQYGSDVEISLSFEYVQLDINREFEKDYHDSRINLQNNVLE